MLDGGVHRLELRQSTEVYIKDTYSGIPLIKDFKKINATNGWATGNF